MLVIGAGSGGLVASYIAANVKAKVGLIEKDRMGGDCLNTGCVPSKALIKAAKVAETIRNAEQYGIKSNEPAVDFAKVMERVHGVIAEVAPHDSIQRYSKLGVDCINAQARFISPWELEVNGCIISAKAIIIACGGTPRIPKIPGIEKVQPLTSDTIWSIKELPKRLLVLGGGPIGCELAQCFRRLGSEVWQIEHNKHIMKIEDDPLGKALEASFKTEGIHVLTRHNIKEFKYTNDKKTAMAVCDNEEIEIEFDQVLVAVGREPNTKGFGLEKLNLESRKNGSLVVNEYLQTRFPNIYACGDITGPYQLTHMASHQAWYCAVNALFGFIRKFKVDYSTVPWCTYTDPECATVGLNEKTATRLGIPYELSTYSLDELDRAICDGETDELLRVLTKPGTDKILGATIFAPSASTMILEFVAAMKHNFGLGKILTTIHIYPSMGEANKYVAGNWRRERISPRILNFLALLHQWRLSS